MSAATTIYFLLRYQLSSNYLERRPQYRQAHLKLATKARVNGRLKMAGALSDPADEALLVFTGPTDEAAIAFAKTDPYVVNGLVEGWTVRPWVTVDLL